MPGTTQKKEVKSVCFITFRMFPLLLMNSQIARNLPEVEQTANQNKRWSAEELYRASMYLMMEEAHPLMYEMEVDKPELLPVD